MEFHRGRLIDHVHIVAHDLAASKRFCQTVLAVLGLDIVEGPGFFYADELFVSPGESGRSHIHLAFQADSPATVKAFHEAGLSAGGKDNGAPGERHYHPGYFAAYLLDPDGNNIEAVYHGPNTRSAASVVITA